MIPEPSPELLRFLAVYEPRVIELALAARQLILEEAPQSSEIVYDAYNAVATVYTYTDRFKDAFCHVAAYRDHVNLSFNRGVELSDPSRRLEGRGKQQRHLRIDTLDDLQREDVRLFVRDAVSKAERSAGAMPSPLQIKSSSRKRRPRAAG